MILVVTPKAGAKHEILFNKMASEVGLLNIKSGLSSTIKCDQNKIWQFWILVTHKAGAKHEILFNKMDLEVGLLNI